MDHKTRVKRAENAISLVHEDQSVSLEQVKDSLEELREFVNDRVLAIEEDLWRREQGL